MKKTLTFTLHSDGYADLDDAIYDEIVDVLPLPRRSNRSFGQRLKSHARKSWGRK